MSLPVFVYLFIGLYPSLGIAVILVYSDIRRRPNEVVFYDGHDSVRVLRRCANFKLSRVFISFCIRHSHSSFIPYDLNAWKKVDPLAQFTVVNGQVLRHDDLLP